MGDLPHDHLAHSFAFQLYSSTVQPFVFLNSCDILVYALGILNILICFFKSIVWAFHIIGFLEIVW